MVSTCNALLERMTEPAHSAEFTLINDVVFDLADHVVRQRDTTAPNSAFQRVGWKRSCRTCDAWRMPLGNGGIPRQ